MLACALNQSAVFVQVVLGMCGATDATAFRRFLQVAWGFSSTLTAHLRICLALSQENNATVTQRDDSDAASGSGEAGHSEPDVPPTVAAPNTAPIPGLTPINATPAAGYCMATPTTMGPSPVLPIKLDSLWSPGLPQPSADLAAPTTATAPERLPAAAEGVDLAAIFISTPVHPTAAESAAASPTEGLVAGDPSAAVTADNNAEPFAEQPFVGFSETATAGTPAAAAAGPIQHGREHQSDAGSWQQNDDQISAGQVTCGSPAAAAMEDATVTEMDDAEPSAPPVHLIHQPAQVTSSPGLAARSSSTPATAAAAAPRSTPGRTPGRASKSPAPTGTPASPWPESDDDLPEAEDEYPEEKLLLTEALAEGLNISDTTQQPQHTRDDQPVAAVQMLDEQTCATAPEQDQFPVVDWADVVAAVAGKTVDQPAAEQEGGHAAYVQQDDAANEEQYSEEDLLHDLPTTDDVDDLMEEPDAPAATELHAEAATAGGKTAATDLPESGLDDEVITDIAGEVATAANLQHKEAADSEAAVMAGTGVDSGAAAGTAFYLDTAGKPDMQANTVGYEFDAAMDSCDSPAAAGPVEADADTTPAKEPAAAADATTSPAGRMTGSRSTTAAPPKSALAKPKDAEAADPKTTARKSAHVMLPDPSPVKGSYKPGLPGSSNDSSSSPGHTPFPTKSKVWAATSAADRAAAAAAKEVNLKKEIAYARAHSALKHYSTSSTPEQQVEDSLDTAAAAAGKKGSSSGGAKPVTSRLLQPTASSRAKSRSSLTSDIDSYIWAPPEADLSSAAVAAVPSKPRLASKVVIPSPPAKAAEPSMKAIKRAIKERTVKKAKDTLAEERSAADTEKV